MIVRFKSRYPLRTPPELRVIFEAVHYDAYDVIGPQALCKQHHHDLSDYITVGSPSS